MKQISFILILLTILSIKSHIYLIVIINLLFFYTFNLRKILILSKKVIKSILYFNLGISLGYILISFFREIEIIEYIIYINLKVFTITYFVFLFFQKNNIIEFFSFSKNLSYLLTITLSQIYSYQKTFEDFRVAYKARVIKKLQHQEKGFIEKTFIFFLKKSLKDSKERTLALKSRGFF